MLGKKKNIYLSSDLSVRETPEKHRRVQKKLDNDNHSIPFSLKKYKWDRERFYKNGKEKKIFIILF